jgi:hypothetical protein
MLKEWKSGILRRAHEYFLTLILPLFHSFILPVIQFIAISFLLGNRKLVWVTRWLDFFLDMDFILWYQYF